MPAAMWLGLHLPAMLVAAVVCSADLVEFAPPVTACLPCMRYRVLSVFLCTMLPTSTLRRLIVLRSHCPRRWDPRPSATWRCCLIGRCLPACALSGASWRSSAPARMRGWLVGRCASSRPAWTTLCQVSNSNTHHVPLQCSGMCRQKWGWFAPSAAVLESMSLQHAAAAAAVSSCSCRGWRGASIARRLF